MHQPNNGNENPSVQNKDPNIVEDGSSTMQVMDLSDDEQELSLAEENAIEECLNDTEGSLSSIDLDLFVPTPKHKRTTKKRSTDFDPSHDFQDDSSLQSISSMEDLSDFLNNSINIPDFNDLSIDPTVEKTANLSAHTTQGTAKTSIEETDSHKEIPRKSYASAFLTVPRSSNPMFNTPTSFVRRRRILRKLRNSPPTNKYDKAHIYSFFMAMADLVVTFPYNQIIAAEDKVTLILHSMMEKLNNWKNDTSPNKPFPEAASDTDTLAIAIKLTRPPFLNRLSKE